MSCTRLPGQASGAGGVGGGEGRVLIPVGSAQPTVFLLEERPSDPGLGILNLQIYSHNKAADLESVLLKSKPDTKALAPSPETEDLWAPVALPRQGAPVARQGPGFVSPSVFQYRLSPLSLQSPASGLCLPAFSVLGSSCLPPLDRGAWRQPSPPLPFYSTHSRNIYRGLTRVPGPGERAANKAVAPNPRGGKQKVDQIEYALYTSAGREPEPLKMGLLFRTARGQSVHI